MAPKRCGQLAGIRLVGAEDSARRLRCAVEARGKDELLIIGRTDALPAAGIDEAIRRARLYRDAGVDLVFVDGIKKIAEVEAVARAVEGPKVVSIVDGETTALTSTDLADGFQVVFYAVTALFTAVKAVSDALAEFSARNAAPRPAWSAMRVLRAGRPPFHQGWTNAMAANTPQSPNCWRSALPPCWLAAIPVRNATTTAAWRRAADGGGAPSIRRPRPCASATVMAAVVPQGA
jgi:hypothetical protein